MNRRKSALVRETRVCECKFGTTPDWEECPAHKAQRYTSCDATHTLNTNRTACIGVPELKDHENWLAGPKFSLGMSAAESSCPPYYSHIEDAEACKRAAEAFRLPFTGTTSVIDALRGCHMTQTKFAVPFERKIFEFNQPPADDEGTSAKAKLADLPPDLRKRIQRWTFEQIRMQAPIPNCLRHQRPQRCSRCHHCRRRRRGHAHACAHTRAHTHTHSHAHARMHTSRRSPAPWA